MKSYHSIKARIKPTISWRYYLLFLLMLSFKIGSSSNELPGKKISLVLRFDDYSTRSNTELELQIIDLFRESNMAFTVGVIPYVGTGKLLDPRPEDYLPLSEYKGSILKDASNEGVIEVALHGYAHQSHSKEYIGSEFRGLDYESQLKIIRKGKDLLEDLTNATINTFVPPWNQYDLNTLKALEACNIYNLSADLHGTSAGSTSIQVLPNSCGILSIKKAIQQARESSDQESIIVALFHAYDFVEEDKKEGLFDFTEFARLINWISDQKDVQVLTVDQLISKLPDTFLKDKFIISKKTTSYSIKLHPIVRGTSNLTYASESYLNTLRIRALLFYAFLFLICATIAFFIINKLKVFITKQYIIVTILNILLILFMSFYTYKNPEYGYYLTIVFTILSAFIIVSFLVIAKNKEKLKQNILKNTQ